MNPYPAEHSVLILDNCHIHHNDVLVVLLYLFSWLMYIFKDVSFYISLVIRWTWIQSKSLSVHVSSPFLIHQVQGLTVHLVKAFLHHHGHMLSQNEDPLSALLEACSCITAEMCGGWFWHAGHILWYEFCTSRLYQIVITIEGIKKSNTEHKKRSDRCWNGISWDVILTWNQTFRQGIVSDHCAVVSLTMAY